jgi:putative membrane protein
VLSWIFRPVTIAYYPYGFGFFPFGLFFGFFWIFAIFWFIRWLFWPRRWGYGWGSGYYGRRYWGNEDRAYYILRERYARGEITKEQFDQMMRDLEQHNQTTQA